MKNVQRLRTIESCTGEVKSCPLCSGLKETELTPTEPGEVIEARCDTCGEPFQITIDDDEGSKKRSRNDERLSSIVSCPSVFKEQH